MAREHPKKREQGVAAEPAVATDEKDRDRLVGGWRARGGWRVEGTAGKRVVLAESSRLGRSLDLFGRRQILVELPESPDDEVVVTLDEEAEPEDAAGDEQRDPASLGELLDHGDRQDRHAERETGEVHRKVAIPCPRVLFAVADPEPGHAEFGEGERQEDVDRVHDDELAHVAV